MSAAEKHRIRTELLPEPYLGNRDAPIVLLNLNPGFSEYDRVFHDDPRGREAIRRNLAHQHLEYPFYLLDPANSYAPGAGWWRERLRELLDVGGDVAVANAIFCVEYFPYHSEKYDSKLDRILWTANAYGRQLVSRAMERDAEIVVMRVKSRDTARWYKALPQLAEYRNVHDCRNWRKPFISRGNLPEGFSRLAEIVKRFVC